MTCLVATCWFQGDRGEVAVFDTRLNTLVANVAVPGLLGGARGVAHTDNDYGEVWTTGSLAGESLAMLATGEGRDDGLAWQVVRELTLPGAGSLSLAAHEASSSLWIDIPLNSDPDISEYAYVLDLNQPETPAKRVPAAAWAGLAGQRVRVLHPQFDRRGREVWLTVWNESDKQSAIVVVNDESRELKEVIRHEALLSPIRTYGLGTRLAAKCRLRKN